MCTCRSLVEKVPFFKNITQSLLARIAQELIHEIYLKNDVILRAGTPANCMYFIITGTVGVYSQKGSEVVFLTYLCTLNIFCQFFLDLSLVWRRSLWWNRPGRARQETYRLCCCTRILFGVSFRQTRLSEGNHSISRSTVFNRADRTRENGNDRGNKYSKFSEFFLNICLLISIILSIVFAISYQHFLCWDCNPCSTYIKYRIMAEMLVYFVFLLWMHSLCGGVTSDYQCSSDFIVVSDLSQEDCELDDKYYEEENAGCFPGCYSAGNL